MWFFSIPLHSAERQAEVRDWLRDDCQGRIGFATSQLPDNGQSDREVAIQTMSDYIGYATGLINACLLTIEDELDAVSLQLRFPDAEQTGFDFVLERNRLRRYEPPLG